MIRPPPNSPPFPSPPPSQPPASTTSAEPARIMSEANITACRPEPHTLFTVTAPTRSGRLANSAACRAGFCLRPADRKSTRLNSSHSQISYAVFCLKKKTGYHQSLFHVYGSYGTPSNMVYAFLIVDSIRAVLAYTYTHVRVVPHRPHRIPCSPLVRL